MHVIDKDSIWHTMEVLCAYGMRSRIWKESKYGTIGYVKFFSCTRGFPKVFRTLSMSLVRGFRLPTSCINRGGA
uniref:Uncharacterized protein n=1 Tax=Oryza glaberrima TaxID=4538 RepID=I1PUA1_ORYGL